MPNSRNHHHNFHYKTQACAVISVVVVVVVLLLLLFSGTHDDNDVVLKPTLEEEAEQTRRSIIYDVRSNQFSRSGYFFDHVSGAIRLAFNHKRSIEEWENDEEDNDHLGSSEEDRSKAAFASDDLPVDREYRSEANEVENLLFFKVLTPTKGRRPWFHKKSNTVFDSGLEDLDPIDNSMLHDPDTTF